MAYLKSIFFLSLVVLGLSFNPYSLAADHVEYQLKLFQPPVRHFDCTHQLLSAEKAILTEIHQADDPQKIVDLLFERSKVMGSGNNVD